MAYPLSDCPVVGCGCEGCEYCRANHDHHVRCLCECDFEQDERRKDIDPPKPPSVESTGGR